MTDAGAYSVTYTGYYDVESRPVRGVVPVEKVVVLNVNGQALVKLMCTPIQLEELALGFLFNEGLIGGMDDVAVVELCDSSQGVDVWLEHEIELPQLRAITSGCSGGATFEDLDDANYVVSSDLRIAPQRVTQLMESLSEEAKLYRRAGGIHTAALAELDADEGGQLVCVAADVGRHNTLDKITGACLREERSMQGYVLLTSGRVSSEMVNKAAHMGVPIVVSRTSPTSLSIRLARSWGITLIGYTRRRSFRVYSNEDRVADL